MMSRYGLMHKIATYNIGSAVSLLDALYCLSDGDCDFNGENGLEYVCNEAKENGFMNNQDYYVSISLKELYSGNSEYDVIHNFLSAWLDNDDYYYEWTYDVSQKDCVVIISIAAITYC